MKKKNPLEISMKYEIKFLEESRKTWKILPPNGGKKNNISSTDSKDAEKIFNEKLLSCLRLK